jgi:hypothetical protein
MDAAGCPSSPSPKTLQRQLTECGHTGDGKERLFDLTIRASETMRAALLVSAEARDHTNMHAGSQNMHSRKQGNSAAEIHGKQS